MIKLNEYITELKELTKEMSSYCEYCDNEEEIEDIECFANEWGKQGLNRRPCPDCQARNAIPTLIKIIERQADALDKYTENTKYMDRTVDEWFAVYSKQAMIDINKMIEEPNDE